MIIFDCPWNTYHHMWNLTQGWRTEGSETTSSDSSFCIDTGSHSNLESPGEIDTSYGLLEEKAEVNSGLRDDAPDSQTDVVKRTTFELVVSRVAYALHMRRFTEYLTRPTAIQLESNLWLLGVSYGEPSEVEGDDAATLQQFQLDFESRLWFTYRSAFLMSSAATSGADYAPLGNTKLQSDVGWGCMLRSGQMMLAQALVNNRLGRLWRHNKDKVEPAYLAILSSFADNAHAPFSIHNIIAVGDRHGLVSGAWIGPSVLCRTLHSLSLPTCPASKALGMAVFVVAGNREGGGGGGGAPMLCIDDVMELCSPPEGSASENGTGGRGGGGGEEGGDRWKAVLILVPLMLGLDKVNERYLPSLQATLSFPQSVGILGGKPGGATYIVGTVNDEFVYLDPHQVQQTVSISSQGALADTSSYHCRVVRRMRVEDVDPSLALGFYCHTKDDFDDFCSRVSDLETKSGGAPMFTIGVKGSVEGGTSTTSKQKNDGETLERGSGDEDWQLV